MRLKWKVGLSDGSVFIEGDKHFPVLLGKDSPWIRLMNYVESRYLEITSLAITDGKRTFNLPSIGKNPKFTAFLNAPKPFEYKFGRVIGGKVSGGDLEVFCRVEAIYENYKLQLWVNENNPDNCYVLTLPL